MDNPFLKRATEYLRDEEAFLAIVSPEPVKLFLSKHGRDEVLYDRLVFVRGTPGSGKTTLAKLFEYPTLAALLRNKDIDTHRLLVATLVECKAITSDLHQPAIIGCRLDMETDYRNFWEFPYPDEVKLSLMTKLIQARAVLSWISNLTSSGIALNDIKILPRQNANVAAETIGGTTGEKILAQAQAVELSLYKIIGALLAPNISKLDSDITSAYHPFDIIDQFICEIESGGEQKIIELKPLIILDDAHLLHPKQFEGLQHWLIRRELRVARWILTRLDVMHPHEALAKVTEEQTDHSHLPGITARRDTTEIMLQSGIKERRGQRAAFRRMAKDMADRYLGKMPLFVNRNLDNLSSLLNTEPESIPSSKQKELEISINATQTKFLISKDRRIAITEEIDRYLSKEKPIPIDIRLAMINVLMSRYAKRTPQRNLFDQDIDPEPVVPLVADSSIYDAARIHLLHKYNRPYYIGIDDVCDASSENAEQFLHLAAILVEALAARLIRSKQASLNAASQTKLLREKAEDIIDHWNFPQYQLVRHLVTKIAELCLAVSLAPNAPLGAGANAYGIPQEDFDSLSKKYPNLARILQFSIAYNAFTVVPGYECKKQTWCLLELGGTVILKHGLTLKRGGFIEGTAIELNSIINEIEQ